MSSCPTICSSVLATSGGMLFCSSCCVADVEWRWWLLRRLELCDDLAAWSPDVRSNSSRPLPAYAIPLNCNSQQKIYACSAELPPPLHPHNPNINRGTYVPACVPATVWHTMSRRSRGPRGKAVALRHLVLILIAVRTYPRPACVPATVWHTMSRQSRGLASCCGKAEYII